MEKGSGTESSIPGCQDRLAQTRSHVSWAGGKDFVTVFQQKALPEDIEVYMVPEGELKEGKIMLIADTTRFCRFQWRGKTEHPAGAVKWNGEKCDIYGEIVPQDGDVVQVGRRKFARLRLS